MNQQTWTVVLSGLSGRAILSYRCSGEAGRMAAVPHGGLAAACYRVTAPDWVEAERSAERAYREDSFAEALRDVERLIERGAA